MKIVSLEASNVLRLRAVHIEPKGSTVLVGGKNGQGKTSVLRSIELALGGVDAKTTPEPVRRGERDARIVVKLENGLVVERTFKGSESELVVRDQDGRKQRSPQAILDDLVGQLAFDPLSFTRLKPAEQIATLKSLVGLDFSELDKKRTETFEARTDLGRELRRVQGAREKVQTFEDAPTERLRVDAMSGELARLQTENKRRGEEDHKLVGLRQQATRLVDEIDRLNQQLAQRTKELEDIQALGVAQKLIVEGMPTHDVVGLLEQIANADAVNRKVDANARASDLDQEITPLLERCAEMTKVIDGIDKQKADRLAAAVFPVPGLAFDDSGVTFQGIPFMQSAASEQIRVSVAIGLALNPKLRVLLVRDASLLDDEALAVVAKMAADHDAQVWLEVVGQREGCSVVITDGQVAGALTGAPATNGMQKAMYREPGQEG